jgi:hypothetical protein
MQLGLRPSNNSSGFLLARKNKLVRQDLLLVPREVLVSTKIMCLTNDIPDFVFGGIIGP